MADSHHAAEKPQFQSYGEFAKSDLFKALFEGAQAPGQERAAKRIVDQVLCLCDGKHYDYPRVDTIVDLGCGDGLLGEAIRAQLKKRGSPIKHYIGIDSCDVMLELAKEREQQVRAQLTSTESQGAEDTVKFLPSTADVLPDGCSINWSTTALLCLSHTWFHLPQDSLLKAIKLRRPGLVVVDVFHDWDDVVRKFSPERGSEALALLDEDERLDCDRKVIYSLRTELAEEGFPKVIRGIYGRHTTDTSRDKWVIRTTQTLRTSADAIRPREDSARTLSVLDQVKRSKERYGDGFDELTTLIDPYFPADTHEPESLANLARDCGYVVIKEFPHDSGWGQMHCVALAALSPEVDRLNDAWFEAVKDLLEDVFIAETSETAAFLPVRGLFDQFCKAEAAVIMPFDPHRTFARFVPVRPRQKASDASGSEPDWGKLLSRAKYILEDPNPYQTQFPTAYGLYQTLLGSVSSPIAFPLQQVHGYEASAVDIIADAIESSFLDSQLDTQTVTARPDEQQQEAIQGKQFDDRGRPPYFLMPFYYGSMPLFTLVLESPSGLLEASTDALVYYSLAQNLVRQLQVSLPLEELRWRVIKPFVTAALPVIATSKASVDERVDHLMTCWRTGRDSQQWKTWIGTLPSLPVVQVAGVKERNDAVERVVRQMAKAALSSEVYQVSVWFGQSGFFSNESHDNWADNAPQLQERTNQLEQILKIGSFDSSRPLQSQVLRSLGSRFGPFAVRRSVQWINFLEGHLTVLAGCSTLRCETANSHFLNLKQVFCRNRGNRGASFRFSPYAVLTRILIGANLSPKNRVELLAALGQTEPRRRYTLAHAGDDAFEQLCWCLKYLSYCGLDESQVTEAKNLRHSALNEGIHGDIWSMQIDLHFPVAWGDRDGLDFEQFRKWSKVDDAVVTSALEKQIRVWTLSLTATRGLGERVSIDWTLHPEVST